MLVANRWAHTGVRDPGLFRSEEQRGLFWKVCLQKETKEGGNGQQRIYSGNSVCRRRQRKGGNGGYLCLGPFILAMGSFDGLTSNFSCPITCFEAIFLFKNTLVCSRVVGLAVREMDVGEGQLVPSSLTCPPVYPPPTPQGHQRPLLHFFQSNLMCLFSLISTNLEQYREMYSGKCSSQS
jgi:hypothetical protein